MCAVCSSVCSECLPGLGLYASAVHRRLLVALRARSRARSNESMRINTMLCVNVKHGIYKCKKSKSSRLT